MSTLIKKINQLLVWSKSFTQASTAVVLIKRKQKYIVEEQEYTKFKFLKIREKTEP